MNRNDERSVSDVLQDIFGNVQDIVRSEVRLAQAEIKTEAAKTARAAKSLIAGAVLGLRAVIRSLRLAWLSFLPWPPPLSSVPAWKRVLALRKPTR